MSFLSNSGYHKTIRKRNKKPLVRLNSHIGRIATKEQQHHGLVASFLELQQPTLRLLLEISHLDDVHQHWANLRAYERPNP
jgi:hypothetical protein